MSDDTVTINYMLVSEPDPLLLVSEPDPMLLVQEPDPLLLVQEPDPLPLVSEPDPLLLVQEPDPMLLDVYLTQNILVWTFSAAHGEGLWLLKQAIFVVQGKSLFGSTQTSHLAARKRVVIAAHGRVVITTHEWVVTAGEGWILLATQVGVFWQ